MAETPSAPPSVTEAPPTHVSEPFEGYNKADVPAIQKRIASIPQGAQRELLKRQVREAELQRDEPRKGVIDATQPQDLPPLGDVAEQRAATRNVRVINTLEEAR